jgi:deoxyadenosine/deoxycytidine kinase
MKKNIAVLGTIGVGKSTLIRRLKKHLEEKDSAMRVEFVPEPSISLPNLSKVLEQFYKDTKSWAYPLQLGVSAAHEIHFQEMRKKDYDVLLFDAPYSSYVYCNIHAKNGRLTEEERMAIDNVSRPFPFDLVIVVQEDMDVTINRITKRNNAVNSGTNIPDLDIEDFSYLEEHIRDFREFQPSYIERYFPDADLMTLDHLPEDTTEEYENLLENISKRLRTIEVENRFIEGLDREMNNKRLTFVRENGLVAVLYDDKLVTYTVPVMTLNEKVDKDHIHFVAEQLKSILKQVSKKGN